MSIKYLFATLVIGALPSLVLADDGGFATTIDGPGADTGAYYKRDTEGWFWYQTKPEPLDEPEAKEAPPPPQPQPAIAEKPSKPQKITSAWLRENMQHYLDRAIDDPTEDNLYDYFLLKRIAVKKSEVFSTQGQLVAKKHPELDGDSIYASNSPTDYAHQRERRRTISDSIRKIKDRAGLFLFWGPDCQLCGTLYGSIRQIKQTYGLSYRIVSVGANQNIQGENTLQDSGQAQMLGVSRFPALFMRKISQFVSVLSDYFCGRVHQLLH